VTGTVSVAGGKISFNQIILPNNHQSTAKRGKTTVSLNKKTFPESNVIFPEALD